MDYKEKKIENNLTFWSEIVIMVVGNEERF